MEGEGSAGQTVVAASVISVAVSTVAWPRARRGRMGGGAGLVDGYTSDGG